MVVYISEFGVRLSGLNNLYITWHALVCTFNYYMYVESFSASPLYVCHKYDVVVSIN